MTIQRRHDFDKQRHTEAATLDFLHQLLHRATILFQVTQPGEEFHVVDRALMHLPLNNLPRDALPVCGGEVVVDRLGLFNAGACTDIGSGVPHDTSSRA